MLPAYARLVADTQLPPLALIRQNFAAGAISDIKAALMPLLAPFAGKIRPGARIAITAGSRGFAGFAEIMAELVRFIKEHGGKPFIVPAMGSHGGATASGQVELLAQLGVSEATAGCPVRAGMETVEVGKLANGMSVQMDRLAHEADGIVLFNRIKPHSAFRAPLESGLAKMLVIGLGKQHGAETCHMWGFGAMGSLIEEMAQVKLASCRILFGVGTIENQYDQLARLAVMAPEDLIAEEKELLKVAMAAMPRLPLGPPDDPLANGKLDVLVVDFVGKEFSGAGMDPNITGRPCSPAMSGGPAISRIAALDVTTRSLGNANGVAAADVITDRLLAKFNRDAVYKNSITSGLLRAAALPMNMPNDRTAIQACVKTCESRQPDRIRLMRIRNTLQLDLIFASEALLPELEKRTDIEILSPCRPMRFDAAGNLADAWPA